MMWVWVTCCSVLFPFTVSYKDTNLFTRKRLLFLFNPPPSQRGRDQSHYSLTQSMAAAAAQKGTDWYSWLCRAGLDPQLTYEYSLLFSRNELEEDDAVHFTHDFLLSMGVSIAKHRLEILKLAKKERRPLLPQPVVRLLTAVKRTKRCIAGYVREMVRRPDESSALVVLPPPPPPPPRSASSYGAAWGRRAALKRGGGVPQGRLLLLTNGSGQIPAPAARGHRRSSTCGDKDRFWEENCDEGIRWDSMFQDLKPN